MYVFRQYGTKQLQNLVVRVRSLWNGCSMCHGYDLLGPPRLTHRHTLTCRQTYKSFSPVQAQPDELMN